MSAQQEQLARLQAALTQLSAPPATAAVLYPGSERYALLTFLLQKLVTPEYVNALQQRSLDLELPVDLSAEEAQAHCLARMLQSVDFQATVDQVRGCTSQEDSLRLLASLATFAAAHQQYLREAAAAAATSPTAASAHARALSPGPALSGMTNTASGQTPRQRTPSRAGTVGASGGGQAEGAVAGGGGGRPLLSLQSLDGEMRILEGLTDRLSQLLELGGGGNWFPGDIMAALQPYLQYQPASEMPASVEQRAQRLRAELPALRAEEARLATEVTLANEAEWQQQAQATRAELADFLETSAAFFHTFQTGLGVWCATNTAADTCGLGPAATELLQRYDSLRRLGADLARIRQAYNSIVSCAPPLTLLEQHTLSQLVRAGQAAVEQLQSRITVQQRLLAEEEAGAARAAAVLRAAGMAQPAL